MWSSDRLLRATTVAVGLALAGCTAGPLYGERTATLGAPTVTSLQGRIAVSQAPDRTTQFVRNPLLFGLNRGTEVSDPLYRVDLTVSNQTTGITLGLGNQLTTAAVRVTGTYRLVRIADGQTIGSGSREATSPYDNTTQLFQQQRASLNAQEEAAETVAALLETAIVRDLKVAGAI